MVTEDFNTSFISGKFSVLHAGHVKLFKFAKSISKKLIVGVYSDELVGQNSIEPVDNRIMPIVSNKFVDEIVIVDKNVTATLFEHKPDLVIKGNEYKNLQNEEQEYIDATFAKMIFSSGATISLSHSLDLKADMVVDSFSQWRIPSDFMKRHNLSFKNICEHLDSKKEKKLLIIGDSILDKYIDCTAIGMSQEEPVIVSQPTKSQNFIGGAAIVAAHSQSMGAAAKLITLLGDDEEGFFITNELNKLNVGLTAHREIGRPTTTKTRYRISGKSVFRLNELFSDDCGQIIQDLILRDISKAINQYDMLIFSDFNYGMLPKQLIDRIQSICFQHKIPIVADSQSSSQFGDVKRYKNTKLVTPTEYEARASLHNKEDGLVQIAEQIRNSVNSDHVFLKLGKDGMIVHNSQRLISKTIYLTDQIPALNKTALDSAGAGDSLMIASSIMLARGSNIWEAALVGSVAAGIQVSRNGNIPVTFGEIKPVLQHMFKKLNSE